MVGSSGFMPLFEPGRPKILDVLYPFHFDKDIDSAIQRLKVSISSLINQDVNINVYNTSTKCIKKYLKDYDNISYYHNPKELEVYCKCMTINLGVKKLITTDYFLMSDIDLVYPPTFIDTMKFFTLAKQPIRIVFYTYVLNKTDKKIETYEDCQEFYKTITTNDRSSKHYAPGNGLIHLESFYKVAGYDERFVGHGSEDGDFNYRISKINKYFEIDMDEVNTYHQYHDRLVGMDRVSLNEKMWRYVMLCGDRSGLPLIKSGDIKFPKNLMELNFS